MGQFEPTSNYGPNYNFEIVGSITMYMYVNAMVNNSEATILIAQTCTRGYKWLFLKDVGTTILLVTLCRLELDSRQTLPSKLIFRLRYSFLMPMSDRYFFENHLD